MTGRDLIVYILENHLENESVFKDGTFVGFISEGEFASKLDVGTQTVRTWVDLNIVNGVYVGDKLYIPAVNAFVTGGNEDER